MKKLFKHLRLLPAVIVLGTGLLVLKGTDITLEARAESAGPAPAAPASAPTGSDPAADDSAPASAAEVDVLTGLAKRRTELDAREQDLATRANLIAAAEQRVDGKIAQLKDLQNQMQTLLGQRDDAEQKEIASLVKTYASMKPKDAARIFNSLDDSVLLEVAAQMKPDVLGAILAGMQPEQAQKLTVKLANRLKPADAPAMQPQPTPALLAANQPAATIPAQSGTMPDAAPINASPAPQAAAPAQTNALIPKATPQAAAPAATAPVNTAANTAAAKTTPSSNKAAPAGK